MGYFSHKDLGGSLHREQKSYIKNEVILTLHTTLQQQIIHLKRLEPNYGSFFVDFSSRRNIIAVLTD